jgi:hypothetical protein
MIKAALVSMLIGGSAVAFASDHRSEPVPGQIVYELPDGSLAERDVAIEMIRNDDGSARFVLHAGSLAINSADAFMLQSRGSRAAYVAFPNAFTAPDGTVSHLLFKGWKLGDAERMVYQGTAYKVSDAELTSSGETLAECIEETRRTGKIDDKWSFAGAFRFDKR